MDPRGRIARRFPLVARPRPACLPLPRRVGTLCELADAAAWEKDPGAASTVFNQAALIASDLDLPDLARDWCQQHAAAYLPHCPLPAMPAIRGLEPLVNLTRLRMRAGHSDEGHRLLLTLNDGVASGTPTAIDGITVPANLVATADERHEVRAWLWRVLLADGTRALTSTGRWEEALQHIEKHRGVGTRMLDGRQTAIIAALTTGDTDLAMHLIRYTALGEPWENAVTACLTALIRQDHPAFAAALGAYRALETDPSLAVFDTRLALTILDALGEDPEGQKLAAELTTRLHAQSDGYAAREVLAHPRALTYITPAQAAELRNLTERCALGAGELSRNLHDQLTTALGTSTLVIARSHKLDGRVPLPPAPATPSLQRPGVDA